MSNLPHPSDNEGDFATEDRVDELLTEIARLRALLVEYGCPPERLEAR